ncbi:hypothetical protein LJ737_22940 [Hymenobacter sp. 15J16-1T3B]|uniref:hypothetical protein n=1 Tax=Hymenobacter sp. 15J16-1T3B TaxID=2886941 RepID=UPI001D129BC8|nr:hypothetical protein [Hymenobacter sp. 15J16-1T3B]MCC3160110.1 hypothetical protein [Hymenobacter sp. 15J16-1T3B]
MNKLSLSFTGQPRPARLLLLPLLLTSLAAQAQSFWQTTPAAPEGPKIGLVATGDSTLLTTVGNGLLRSPNRGRSWQLALRTHQVYALHAGRNGQLLAGGAGKVYRSPDGGATWDSVTLNTTYPVISFAETPQGGLLAGTGDADQTGFVGDGVFYSADQGLSWTGRSNGFGASRYVSQLVADRQGRIYAALSDEVPSRQPGLYRSEDQGQNWQYIPLRVDGRNAINDDLVAYEVLSLSVSPQDSLLCSFHGVFVTGQANNVPVAFNLSKQLGDVANPNRYWTVQQRSAAGMWWNQTPRHRVFFARNGDVYASRTGGVNSGGTLRSTDQGRSWTLLRGGLGLSAGNTREPQTFAELPDGSLFMVQDMDEQVYWTNASLITASRPRSAAQPLALYPNPAGDAARVDLPPGARLRTLRLTDLGGRVVRTFAPPAPSPAGFTLDLRGTAAGVYVVTATLADGRTLRQRLVRQ